MTACIARSCRSLGYHVAACDDADCRGCQPRRAADGLQLCGMHRDRIAEDAVAAATLHGELALALTSSGAPGEKVKRSDEGSPGVNPAAADARSEIRSTLASWCRLIGEERGLTLPEDKVTAMGRYLARHADWLAAHPAADDVVDELHELAHGRPRRIAYPGGSRKFPVALPDGSYAVCPESLTDEETGESVDCPGTLWTILRKDASLLPSEIACNHSEQHRWPTSRWLRLGARLTARTTESEAA